MRLNRRRFLLGSASAAALVFGSHATEAAFAIFQTAGSAVNSRNLVTNFGGVGDAQRQTVNVTVSSASPTLTVGTAIFVSGDVGKTISIWNGSNYKTGTISGFTSSTVVTLNGNVGFTVTGSSSDVLWGTDNTNAFTGPSGYRAWAQTQTNPASPPVLYVPDGNYAYQSSTSAGGGLHYGVFNSAKISGLSGNAANCKLMQFSNGEMRFGTDVAIVANRGYNTTQSGGNSVRLATASASVTTTGVVSYNTIAADGSRFDSRIVVGRVCLLANYDMQGTYNSFVGYPPNNYFFEWNVIQAYNSTTGVITFQNPLTQDYKSTYPAWGVLNTQFGSDQGGPFTMWIAPDGYNNTVTLENMTIDSPHNQCALHMRNWIGNNLVMSGPGLYPTQNDVVALSSCTYPQVLEIDKMVNQVTWNNCSLNQLQQQSASPNRMILNGGTINQLETAKYTEANNVSFTGTAKVILGVSSYGRTNQVVLNNCTGIAAIQRGGASTDDLGGSTPVAASTFYTFSAGLMQFANTTNDTAGGTGQANVTRCFVPGQFIYFDDKAFDQILDVTQDATNTYVQFKNITNWPFTPVTKLTDHSCYNLTVTSCTGTAPELSDMNNAPANAPAYSYVKRTYTETLATNNTIQPTVFGKLTSATAISVNVTTAYTGGSALTWRPTQFATQMRIYRSGAIVSLDMTINAKIVGNRVYNGTNQTWSGAQSGDSLPVLLAGDQLAGTNQSAPCLSANVNGQGLGPVIIYEIKADQNV